MALAKACADLRAGAVRELNLGNIGIGDDGARALVAALEQNGSLTTLYLAVRPQQQRSGRETDASGAGQSHRRSLSGRLRFHTVSSEQEALSHSASTLVQVVQEGLHKIIAQRHITANDTEVGVQ
jgi:hypothetical protein